MKVKVHKSESDIIMDYFRLKDMDSFRLDILEYIVSKTEGDIVLYIDTNSRIKPLPFDRIKRYLMDCGVEYSFEPIVSAKRGILGFGSFLTTGRKKKKLPENLIVAKINVDTPLKQLYNDILFNYDYALGLGSSMGIDELMLRLKNDPFNVLFKKEMLKNTIYDSIVARRTRMDSPYDILDGFDVSRYKA
jgi:hypothetical protein